MTYWQSPSVSKYIDVDAVAESTYQLFYKFAPRVTGHMASGIDYQVTGDSIYFWDDVEYAGYQDELIGKDGHKGAYYDWWSGDLPATFDRVVTTLSQDTEVPEWLSKLVEDSL